MGLRLSHLCLGAAGHSCLQKARFGSVVSQLLPPPVPAGSQPSSLAGLEGVGNRPPLPPLPLSLHFPSPVSAPRGPT